MDKRIPAALIRKVWMDPTITSAEAARRVGLARVNLWHQAKRLGLPPRPTGRRATIPRDDRVSTLWAAGVLVEDIARVIGCHRMSVARLARELGLPRRKKGARRITLAEFEARALAGAMAAMAQAENRALKERLA